MLDQERFVTGESGPVDPVVACGGFGKIILTNAVVVMYFEYYKIFR